MQAAVTTLCRVQCDVALQLVVCRVLCCKVVGTTSSEGFLECARVYTVIELTESNDDVRITRSCTHGYERVVRAYSVNGPLLTS